MIRLEKSHENPVTHFPKLEVGQKLFSIIDKRMVKITFKNCTKLKIEYPRTTEIEFGKGNQDLYLLYFTANPFENLQRVEPLEAETTEERDIRCGKISAKFDKKGTETISQN